MVNLTDVSLNLTGLIGSWHFDVEQGIEFRDNSGGFSDNWPGPDKRYVFPYRTDHGTLDLVQGVDGNAYEFDDSGDLVYLGYPFYQVVYLGVYLEP